MVLFFWQTQAEIWGFFSKSTAGSLSTINFLSQSKKNTILVYVKVTYILSS